MPGFSFRTARVSRLIRPSFRSRACSIMLAGIVIQLAIMVFYVLYMAIWAWKAKVQVKRAGRRIEIMLLGMFVASVGIIVRGVIPCPTTSSVFRDVAEALILSERSATVLRSWRRASTAGSRNSRSGNSLTPFPSPSRLTSSSMSLPFSRPFLRVVFRRLVQSTFSFPRNSPADAIPLRAASPTLTGSSSTQPKSMPSFPCPKSRTMRPNRRARPRPTERRARRRSLNVQLLFIRRRSMSRRTSSVIRPRDALVRAPRRCRVIVLHVRQRRANLAEFLIFLF